MQQQSLLLLAALISFLAHLWLEEFIGVQVNVGFRVESALS